MAGDFTSIYRNLNDSDMVVNTNYTPGTSTFPTIDVLGWSKDGYQFKEYNLSRDGTRTSYHPGENISTSQNIYVIWEEIPKPTRYIVEASELTSIADTIRTKSGQSGSLSFPNGFNMAINNISGSNSGSGNWVGTDSKVKVSLTQSNFTDYLSNVPENTIFYAYNQDGGIICNDFLGNDLKYSGSSPTEPLLGGVCRYKMGSVPAYASVSSEEPEFIDVIVNNGGYSFDVFCLDGLDECTTIPSGESYTGRTVKGNYIYFLVPLDMEFNTVNIGGDTVLENYISNYYNCYIDGMDTDYSLCGFCVEEDIDADFITIEFY